MKRKQDKKILEKKIGKLLDDFCHRRIEVLNGLDLRKTLKKKNPYLFKAVGVLKASKIVEGLLSAYMSSSEEGIFGDAFFEPLAKFVSGGHVSPSEGVDVAIEDKRSYKAVAVKSGPSVFNSQSKKKQMEDFSSLEARLRKLRKHFDPVIGYCYGSKQQKKAKTKVREIAGQAFWQEITGDPDFYLKIIRLMKKKPLVHLPEYQNAWNSAVNRFTRDFVSDFCFQDGTIDWEKLTKFNSGIPLREGRGQRER